MRCCCARWRRCGHCRSDELLQLSDTWHRSLTQTLNSVAHNPGGVPLAYLAENLFVNGTGAPFYMAHAFSIVCAVGGLTSLIWLVRLLRASGGWRQVALVYALLPISLRYAVEARQYGPALALSIAATALLFGSTSGRVRPRHSSMRWS